MATTNYVAWALGVWGDGVWAADVWEGTEEEVSKAGGAKGKKRFTPWQWVPYTPVKTRSRKKREQELVAFLNP